MDKEAQLQEAFIAGAREVFEKYAGMYEIAMGLGTIGALGGGLHGAISNKDEDETRLRKILSGALVGGGAGTVAGAGIGGLSDIDWELNKG